MSTSYTTNLGFALPTDGELDGAWGDVVNASITQLVEDAIANSASKDITSADWTLSTTGSGVANEARMAVLIVTGTPGVTRNIIAPAKSKSYIVVNKTGQSVVLKSASTTGVTVASNTTSTCVWSGTDYVMSTSPVATTSYIVGLSLAEVAPTITTNTVTIDCSTGNMFAVNLNANIVSFTISNIPVSTRFYAFVLELTADGTARTVTWTFQGTPVRWVNNNNIAPTLTSTAGKKDLFVFYTYDAGATWIGLVSGQNA